VANQRSVKIFTARERKPLQLGEVITSVELSSATPMNGASSFMVALPGVTQDEAKHLANEIAENFTRSVKYVEAHDKQALVRSLNRALSETTDEHYDLRGVSKKRWSRRSSMVSVTDYSYELRPSWWPSEVTSQKFETLNLALESDRVLRFLYPGSDGALRTRRVEAMSWIVKPWGVCFNGRRFDYDGVERFRTYSLDKAVRFQVETLHVKHLNPTIVLELQLKGRWFTVAFQEP